MDMKYEEFEKHIASSLRKETTDLDIGALIEGIHGSKENKRPILLYWLLGTLTILSIGFSSVYMYSDESNVSEKFETKNNEEIKISTLPTSNIEAKDNKNNHILLTKESTISTIEEENISFVSKSKFNNSTITQSIKETNSIIKSINIQPAPNTEIIDGKSGKENMSPSLGLQNTVEEKAQSKSLLQIPSIFTDENDVLSLHKLTISPDKVKCPTFGKKSSYFLEIIPELGYFRPVKKLEQISNEPNNIFDLRKDNERSLEGINTGLYLRLRNDKLPIYIQGGVSASRLTERMSLDYSYTRRDTTKGIISITQSQSGDTITVIYGDIVQETKVSGQKTSHHNFTLIDFPISVGIEKRFGQWSAGIEGGVILNLSLNAGGQILATDTSFTAIDVPVSPYRQKLGIGYSGGVTIGREFNQAGRVFLALRGRVIPVPFSLDQSAIRQSYSFIGLNFGYVYTF